MKREWKIEEVTDNFSGRPPHPAIARLDQLEREGWTILNVSPRSHSTSLTIVAFREAPGKGE